MCGYMSREVEFEVERVWCNQRTTGYNKGFRATLTCQSCGRQYSAVAGKRDRARLDVEIMARRGGEGV